MVLIVGITLLNVLISWYNAKTAGQVWAETKTLGGMIRLVVWCAAIMSAIGFSSAYLLGLLLVVVPFLEPQQATELVKYATSFWYVLVIAPVLGTGLIVTVHSWIMLYRERRLLDMAAASWNTFAQIHNMANAANSIGPALKDVSDGFSRVLKDSKDPNSKIFILGVVLALLALLLGVLTTAVIIRRYEGTLPLPEELARA